MPDPAIGLPLGVQVQRRPTRPRRRPGYGFRPPGIRDTHSLTSDDNDRARGVNEFFVTQLGARGSGQSLGHGLARAGEVQQPAAGVQQGPSEVPTPFEWSESSGEDRVHGDVRVLDSRSDHGGVGDPELGESQLQESHPASRGLDQVDPDLGDRDGHRNPGEPCAGTEIGRLVIRRTQKSGRLQAVEKMPLDQSVTVSLRNETDRQRSPPQEVIEGHQPVDLLGIKDQAQMVGALEEESGGSAFHVKRRGCRTQVTPLAESAFHVKPMGAV